MEQDHKIYFKGKKITVMGLGLLGRGVGDVKFLAECGADLIVTDLKSKDELKGSLEKLKNFPEIKFTLGEHKLEDFRDRDLILKSAGVPENSKFLLEAKKNQIPISMSTALFAKFSPAKIIGITGTRGKSTVTYLIYEILKEAGFKVFLGGNIRGVSTLPHLPCSTKDEIAVLELDSWQLQGFEEEKMSPDISVFTNLMPDHLNYYKNDIDAYFEDKANIFKFQKEGDQLILGEKMVKLVEKKYPLSSLKSKVTISSFEDVPKDWSIKIPGKHNLENIACAIDAVRPFNIDDSKIKKAVENFKGAEGRLEFLREFNGIKIYNDTNATTPEATLAGVTALKEMGDVVLIAGGADKKLSLDNFEKIFSLSKEIVFLPGTGTDILFREFNLKAGKQNCLESALHEALKKAKNGDIIVLSPGFASFGPPPGGFKNEYDRGDQFKELVSRL